MGWLKQTLTQVLTGPDNRTVAIGRVIAFGIALLLLTVIPIIAVVDVLIASITSLPAKVAAWHELLIALAYYVPAVAAAIWGVVFGTNPTEPPHRAHDDGPNAQP